MNEQAYQMRNRAWRIVLSLNTGSLQAGYHAQRFDAIEIGWMLRRMSGLLNEFAIILINGGRCQIIASRARKRVARLTKSRKENFHYH